MLFLAFGLVVWVLFLHQVIISPFPYMYRLSFSGDVFPAMTKNLTSSVCFHSFFLLSGGSYGLLRSKQVAYLVHIFQAGSSSAGIADEGSLSHSASLQEQLVQDLGFQAFDPRSPKISSAPHVPGGTSTEEASSEDASNEESHQ